LNEGIYLHWFDVHFDALYMHEEFFHLFNCKISKNVGLIVDFMLSKIIYTSNEKATLPYMPCCFQTICFPEEGLLGSRYMTQVSVSAVVYETLT
jgi:hypothetical protein